MRRLISTGALVCAAVLTGCATDTIGGPGSRSAPSFDKGENLASTFSYETFDVPGATTTIAWGINARGDVVGTYGDAARRFHGFVRQKGGFTTIDYPGAIRTELRGIGPAGDIVGAYARPGELGLNNFHGFVLTRHGEFVDVDQMGHMFTIAQRILPDGTVLGCYHDRDTMMSMHGIVVDGDDRQSLPQSGTMANGATPDGGRITGLVNDMDGTSGFILEDGVFTKFRVPGSTFTAAWDMNPAGQIAGTFANATGAHGFVRLGDDYTTLNVPGASATRGFGINARGEVVGSYTAAGTTHGYIATPANR